MVNDIRATLSARAITKKEAELCRVPGGGYDFTLLRTKRSSRRSRRAQRVLDNAALGGKVAKRGKKKKSPSLSKLKKELWHVLREVVYAEAPNICMTCGATESAPVACHIVPASESALLRFFLPNLYRGCHSCNKAEQSRRGQWVKLFEERFGEDYVNALYWMAADEMLKPINERFQIKKWWVLEQTARMRKLLEAA